MDNWLAKIFTALVVGLVGVGALVVFAFSQQGATRNFLLVVAGVLGALCIFGIFVGAIRSANN